MERLELIARTKFGTDPKTLLDILEYSHGAEGYILGALGENVFKNYAENLGYDVLRIKEKPEGGYDAKNDDARGDFYIKKKNEKGDKWYVVECKSVKSNAEARAGILTKEKCVRLLKNVTFNREEHIKGIYLRGLRSYQKAKDKWKSKSKFPIFMWNKNNPGAGVPDLLGVWETEQDMENWVNSFSDEQYTKDAYWNLSAPVRLIQTHMPSSRIDNLGIKSTGPLVSEFSILCLDLFLRTGKHELIFANSKDLNHQAAAPNHLQQNYTIDILVEKDGFKRHKLLFPWYDDLEDCIVASKPIPRKIDESQLDFR